jgi:Do/DeqQ family serine protease
MKSNWKSLALVGLVSSGMTLGAYHLLGWNDKEVILNDATPSAFTRFTSGVTPTGTPSDFTAAAKKATPAVVHIKAKIVREVARQEVPDIFEEFFGRRGSSQGQPRRQEGRASGSGVIISENGYIVTNNHVVAEARELEVVLNDRRTYPAKVIGTDPNSDLAVIQIQEKNLPFLTFGDSDGVEVGEWVLAVGNPFDLESTVTAGIVSAKGRGIGIIEGNGNPLESFIQTDAAVNPGNSGGALVNLKGELVGINTAIASNTGSYAGYSFAVPVAIVKKVAGDLLKYGSVQRAFLGISKMQEVNNVVAEQLDLKVKEGVYIGSFGDSPQFSAAKAAGVKVGDVVTKIDGVKIGSVTQLVEVVGRHQPGDKVRVTVDRSGEAKEYDVTLKNIKGTTNVLKSEELAANGTNGVALENLGIKVADLSSAEKAKYRLSAGVKVTEVGRGPVSENTEIAEGFIITSVDGKPVRSAREFAQVVGGRDEGIRLEGTFPDAPGRYSYSF